MGSTPTYGTRDAVLSTHALNDAMTNVTPYPRTHGFDSPSRCGSLSVVVAIRQLSLGFVWSCDLSLGSLNTSQLALMGLRWTSKQWRLYSLIYLNIHTDW